MLQVEAFNESAFGARHGFFTRNGGVSRGEFASLNCGYECGDDPVAVEANRRLAMLQLAQPEGKIPVLVTMAQIHQASVAVVGGRQQEPPLADALVTACPGLALGVLTADCAPVVFASARVIGAAHAGWRGLYLGVLEATVNAMREVGAGHIVAAVGPCIGKDSYEVGAEFQRYFGDNCLFESDGRWWFDLPGYVRLRLEAIGVEVAGYPIWDTAAGTEHFFSHRRSRGQQHGRCLSAIYRPQSDFVTRERFVGATGG